MASCGNVTEYFRGKLDGNKDKEQIDSLQNALSQMEQRLEASTSNGQIAEVSPDAPEIFTLVYATSDDGFVNVRQSPSAKAAVLDKVWVFNHGLGDAVKIGQQGKWVKVRKGNVEGWCNGNYLGYQDWYSGYGKKMLVAKNANTPIYCVNYENGDYQLFGRVPKGTIIADEFDDYDGKYYVLITAHDCLFIRKSDVIVRSK